MSPNGTRLRPDAEPGSTADIKERVKIRSDATTVPKLRQKTWNQIEKLLEQWQTRGPVPADDQPGPTKAHRRAVLDYEHEQCLQQLTIWREAEERFIRVTSLILHLEYASLLAHSINVVRVADLPVREDIAEKTKDTVACRNKTRRREGKLPEIQVQNKNSEEDKVAEEESHDQDEEQMKAATNVVS